ncbi:MAG: methylcobalamin:coenzyme M methyltransferase [Smithella sp. PtaU1.Bin162]|nr:MAG: methylcobalamin:coenzyme M methyltransferase [Smithella sp. PtaU1.Bin162]
MKELTGKERISRILKRKPVDRIGLFEHFWGDTLKTWQAEGHINEKEDLTDHFKLDMAISSCFKMQAKIDFKNEIIEEDEETVLERDGNGATLRRHKLHDATPEHVDFLVKEWKDWEEHIKPFLKPTRDRIDFKTYRQDKDKANKKERFYFLGGPNVFELMHPVCGHEYMLLGMGLDPDWIKDMVGIYSELIVNLMETLFAEEGKPDGIWFYEDMGFKGRPFISLDMYREIIQPGHKKTIDFAHSLGLPVIMHSCGFVEPLVPGFIESGVDCLQVIEVKAGMDLLKLKREFGDKLVFCGGMDARNLVANNIDAIRAELHEKIPVVKEGYGYILHSDHSIPTDCSYETYRYFVDEGLKLGRY